MKWRAPTTIELALAASLCAALIIWAPWKAAPAPVGQAVPAAPAKETLKQPKVLVKIKTMAAYAPKVKADFGLPVAAIGNANEHVVAAARVAPDERPHTVVATVDAETGEAVVYDRADPPPWLAREVRGEAGITQGLKNGLPTWRISARQNIIQIKAMRVGAAATIDQDGDWYAGVGLFYRW